MRKLAMMFSAFTLMVALSACQADVFLSDLALQGEEAVQAAKEKISGKVSGGVASSSSEEQGGFMPVGSSKKAVNAYNESMQGQAVQAAAATSD